MIVVRAGPVSARFSRRALVVAVVLVAAGLALGFAGLARGTEWSPPGEVLAALAGRGEEAFVILQWRLPRVCAAAVFGAGLGLAGAVFQNLTRNPLGSPDVIGLDAGAYTGALIVLTAVGGTAFSLTGAAMLGGLLTAAVVYALSLRSGLDRRLLIVVGIAVNAVLTAVNSWIVLRVDLEVALAASGWSTGSLNGLDWSDVGVPFLVVGVLAALLAALSRAMHQAGLGDELAVASGVAVGRLRLLTVFAGVGCTATVTAVTGPIVFVALAAPHIGRRLAGAAGVPLLPAALTGAVLLLAADLTAQLLLAPVALPVGVVTTAIGGGYLLWLLFTELRRGPAAGTAG
ncbi:FecCD family ABC transporter permease [Actinophytocola gossypii]|uniref:Iron chelate uptake ABC transporter family permease subunit n=1 Tax=Actinophytocola gossypii TaxID=2812003 RepID=A0ABT2J952_9PSEU|nr:iron chelate uptake ABC transporter family permease subunit [Actinophytocola gossypii]MCT2584391.1 iron chelate uptake ABC transporter family permease subunit [Actinophytocola gossypii]